MDDPLEEFPNRQTCAFVAVKSERHRPLYKPFISDGQLAPCGTAILIVSINGYEQRRVKLGACAEEKAMYALSVIRAYEILPETIKRNIDALTVYVPKRARLLERIDQAKESNGNDGLKSNGKKADSALIWFQLLGELNQGNIRIVEWDAETFASDIFKDLNSAASAKARQAKAKRFDQRRDLGTVYDEDDWKPLPQIETATSSQPEVPKKRNWQKRKPLSQAAE